jgi:ribosomal protein S18 acetylase RimI-like enzyme
VITIQPATPEDIPTLRALARRIWDKYYPGIISREQIDYMLARMYAAKTLRREMAEGVAWDLVIRQTEPVGFISHSFDAASRRVKLSKLYLLPEWHGHGFGRQMLQHVQARSAELGALEIWLQVNKQNTRAIRAYERAGFSVRETVVTDIGGGFVMDDFIMALRLREQKE